MLGAKKGPESRFFIGEMSKNAGKKGDGIGRGIYTHCHSSCIT
jgi:hypothetical protein